MPFTPFHYPVAYLLYRLNKKLSLPGLAIGSMFPDLEIPFIVIFAHADRLVLHSLLGGAIVGTILSVIITTSIYPLLISKLFKINFTKVKTKCSLSFQLVISCLLGNLSHVLLDFINHPYNPIFWPVQSYTFSPICQALGGMERATIISQIVLGLIFIASIVSQRKNIWEKILIGE